MGKLWRWLWELPFLIVLNVIVSFVTLWEYMCVVWRYYGNKSFRTADTALLRSYLWHNPYAIHKLFLEQSGEEDVYRYGETFLTTMETLTQQAALTAEDSYLELGCGRGRTCFWVRAFIGCGVTGMDYVPEFIEKAQAVVDKQKLEGMHFYCRNFLSDPWEPATVIYVDATLLENAEIAQLVKRFNTLPVNTRVIAVNLTLTTGYADTTDKWREEKRLTVPYPWGATEVTVFHRANVEDLSDSVIAED
jgi:SAM-dependent methyltransferase